MEKDIDDMVVDVDTQEDSRVMRERGDRVDRDDVNDLEEKLAALRDGIESDILPSVREGEANMHYCWLSTTNQTDPIFRRQQKGYVLVKAEELPEFRGDYRVSSGQFEGCICVNEMILAKIHKRLYHELMLINHHERPLQEEELIKQNAVKTEQDRTGKELGGLAPEDRGYRTLVNRRKAPSSF